MKFSGWSMTYTGLSSCMTPRHWLKNCWSPVIVIGVHRSAIKAMQQSAESNGIHQCSTSDAVVHRISVARHTDQQSLLYFTDLTWQSVAECITDKQGELKNRLNPRCPCQHKNNHGFVCLQETTSCYDTVCNIPLGTRHSTTLSQLWVNRLWPSKVWRRRS